jgi:NhaA family Na+:H+ antiporter
MATDIAFALGVLALFGARAPIGLKVFLTALAIADDLGAVLVIAVFYTESIRLVALAIAASLLVIIALASRANVRSTLAYVVLGLGVWAAVLASGVHATVAGVLTALLVPVRARRDPQAFWSRIEPAIRKLRGKELTRDSMVMDHDQLHALESLHCATSDMVPPGLALEHRLHPVLAYGILPLFAFMNAGVALTGADLAAPASISLGIVLGLVVGKPLGILLMSWLTVMSGRGELPAGVTWLQILGAGLLGGVGFTMALFIGDLAFSEAAFEDRAKQGILAASAIAAVAGFAVVALGTRGRRPGQGAARDA